MKLIGKFTVEVFATEDASQIVQDSAKSVVRLMCSVKSPLIDIQVSEHVIPKDDLGPRHKHDCTACVFLGRATDTENDLYFCTSTGSLIVRYGSYGSDYASHQVAYSSRLVNPIFIEARRLAVKKGLIK